MIEIGDLSEKKSMEYLTKKCKINEIEVKKLYELVSSRIVKLKDVADNFLAGQSFKGICYFALNEFMQFCFELIA